MHYHICTVKKLLLGQGLKLQKVLTNRELLCGVRGFPKADVDVAFETGCSDSSKLAWCLIKARRATAHSWQEETLSISGSGILPGSS